MLYGLYLSTAGALVETTRVETVANNLANANTPAFRRDFAVFAERATEARENDVPFFDVNKTLERIGGGLQLDETPYVRADGSLTPTDNPLDLAIEGPGYFAVRDVRPDGKVRFTRAGNFTRNHDGLLVTPDGKYRVLDRGGDAIRLPDDGNLTIDRTGRLMNGDVEVAKLDLRTADPSELRKYGDNTYEFIGDGEPEQIEGLVLQGMLEGSTVNPVIEMVSMINGHRAYEANMRLITQQDRTLQRAVNDIGRAV